jgi:hypothetical protein
VQELLIAKRDLKLSKVLEATEYVRWTDHRPHQLRTVESGGDRAVVHSLGGAYERGSVLLTSNLPFSKWETIFKAPMTTAAAIDRLVHHSVILELNIPSYRLEQAKQTTQLAAQEEGDSPGRAAGTGRPRGILERTCSLPFGSTDRLP